MRHGCILNQYFFLIIEMIHIVIVRFCDLSMCTRLAKRGDNRAIGWRLEKNEANWH